MYYLAMMHTNNIQSSRVSFDAGKAARSAVVNGVSSDEVRQQAFVGSSHPVEWCVIQTSPRTVNNRYAVLHYSQPVTCSNITK